MTGSLADTVARDGFAVVDLLDDAGVARALEVVAGAALAPDHDFYASPALSWGPVAAAIDQQLKDIAAPTTRRLLPDHRAFLAGITSKGASSTRTIKFHQDWTYTDERRWRVVFLWCPLVDVDATNAALCVVPGSHRWSDHIRPSREQEATEHFQERLAERAVCIPLRAGQALAFDPAALHGSGTNHTDRPRPAFTMAYAPVDAPLVHFHLDPTGDLTGYAVDAAFFTEHPYRTRPSGYPAVTPHAPALTEATLADAIERTAPR